MSYIYLSYYFGFYDSQTKELINSDYPKSYGEYHSLLFDNNFIDDYIKSGQANTDYKTFENFVLKHTCENNIISKTQDYYLLTIDFVSNGSNVTAFSLVVKLDDIHTLTHGKIFKEQDVFLKTLFSHHIKYQNLLLSQTANLHIYGLNTIIESLSYPRIYNLNKLDFSDDMIIPLYSYQVDSVNWMIDREKNGLTFNLCYDRTYALPDKRFYNYNNEKFESKKEYKTNYQKQIYGGIILDDVGIGKTVQLLSLIKSNASLKTAILVPNHLKAYWKTQMEKHFKTPFTNTTIFSFNEYKEILPCYERIIIDEIHELFVDSEIDIFKLPKIKYRWGLTATPFPKGDLSIYGLLAYLIWDKTFPLEIVKYKQNVLIWNNIFRKNCLTNITKDVKLPKIYHTNHMITLNTTERHIYETQKMDTKINNSKLLEICCDIIMQNNSVCIESLSEFVENTINVFKNKYEQNVEQGKKLEQKISDIDSALKNSLWSMDLLGNKKHYETLLKEQNVKIESSKAQYEHISSSLNDDIECPICLDVIENVFTITKCRHVFCSPCFNITKTHNQRCPSCRTPLSDTKDYKEVSKVAMNEYNMSSKITKLIELVQDVIRDNTKDKKVKNSVIIYTQFNHIITKMKTIFQNINIKCDVLNNGNYNKDCDVLLISSKTYSAGLDLSHISNIIIFEPFIIDKQCVESYEKQIIGRINRIGQKNECHAHRLICGNTIEETLYSTDE